MRGSKAELGGETSGGILLKKAFEGLELGLLLAGSGRRKSRAADRPKPFL